MRDADVHARRERRLLEGPGVRVVELGAQRGIVRQRSAGHQHATIGEQDRADRSIRDHMTIIEAIEARDTERAEALVRDHALGLADHVEKYADYLD